MIRPIEIIEEVFWGKPVQELDTPLLSLAAGQTMTWEDVFKHMLFIGSQGSGKTSSGRTLYRAFLRHEFGGLVLCVKESQAAEFLEVCEQCGRAKDVILFGPNQGHVFNPLEGASLSEATALLLELAEVVSERVRPDLSPNEAFWRKQSEMALRYLLVLCKLVYGRYEVPGIAALFGGRANSANQVVDPTWRERSVMAQALALEAARSAGLGSDLGLAVEYFREKFPYLDNRMQSSVVATVDGIIDDLRRQPLAGLFGGESTFRMRDLLHTGKICVVAMPTQGSESVGVSPSEGRIANAILQFCFCRAATQRQRECNVFLISDECQETVTRELMRQLSVLREYRVATVLLTQNLAMLDGRVGDTGREGILSNLKTKVFLQQDHAQTREWAAQQIGKVMREKRNLSQHWGRGGRSHGENPRQVEEYCVMPVRFAKLKPGGSRNNWIVESVMLKEGEVWLQKWHQKKPGKAGTAKPV